MSDFLSNLAARSLTNAKAVRPRLTSLFEPQNPAFIRPANENFEFEHLIEQVPEEAEPRKRSDVVLSERPDIGAMHSERNLRQAPRRKNETSPGEAVQNVLRPHREVKTPEPASEEFSTANQSRSNHQSQSPHAVDAEVFSPKDESRRPKFTHDFKEDMPERNRSFDEVRQQPKVVGSLPETARQKGIPFASLRSRSGPISAGASRVQQMVQPEGQANRSKTVNVNPYPPHFPAARYSEPAALRQSGPLGMPDTTIEVTIGRIEVKAAPPPSLPRTQSQKSPKTSLDEYLHQRSKGGIK